MPEYYRIDWTNRDGVAKNYAINVCRQDAVRMADSLLADDAYTDGELVESVNLSNPRKFNV